MADAASTSTVDHASLTSDVYRPVIAAIDFGTSSSGYAFAFQDKNNLTESVKETQILMNQWKISSASSTTEKAPTTVLLKPDGTFDSFGYKAEDKYAKLCDTNKHKGWRFFQKFKMLLYNTKELSRDVKILDAVKQPMRVIEVFSAVIGHLKEKLLNDIRIQNNNIEDNDVLYVLTVPAIWSDAAKQFMREAATSKNVGITDDQLKLVLEPEAASVYCRQTPSCAVRKADGMLKLTTLPVGHKYVIVDLGGGTCDIASHKVIKDGMLHEIQNARGDNMGGEMFNIKFIDCVSTMFGTKTFEEWKQKEKADYLTFLRSTEGIKWEISEHDADDDMIFKLPNSLVKHVERSSGKPLQQVLEQSKHSESIQVCGDTKLSISLSFLRQFFADILQGLERHLKDVTHTQHDFDTVFLVGGLAKSEYIRRHVQRIIPNCRLIVPRDPGVAVLKGAILLGDHPSTIAGRIALFSYGMRVGKPFVKGTHREDYMFERDGEQHCNNVFDIMISKGHIMKFGEKFESFMTLTATQEQLKKQTQSFFLYQSTLPSPIYTTEAGCIALGGCTLQPPQNGWDDHTSFTVEIIVGEAEFKFHITESNGRTYEAKIDFLLPTSTQ